MIKNPYLKIYRSKGHNSQLLTVYQANPLVSLSELKHRERVKQFR